ncbi:MAG: V-type ATPase subunit, partial [Clostridia bacterium]|nr:V-type ATPase subunit [Clostridia bacterium]
ERMSDDYIIDLLRQYRSDNQNYMMFYGYVLARLYELKNIRIICGGVKAGVSKEQIKAKLRKVYVG